MTVKGVEEVKRRIGQFFIDVDKKKTEQALYGIMMTARGYAALRTPEETAVFVNSIDYTISPYGSAILYYRGGFSEEGFNFGHWLETNENWNPVKKPIAGPHFLRDAFESPDARQDIMNIIKAAYKL